MRTTTKTPPEISAVICKNYFKTKNRLAAAFDPGKLKFGLLFTFPRAVLCL